MDNYSLPLIFCINLDKRKDRWIEIQKIANEVGIQIIRLPAETDEIGWKGCGRSHLKACRIAKMLDLPWVLVIEDDCSFTKDAWNRFVSYLPTLWQKRNEWKYFNGGPTYINWIKPWDKDMSLASGHALTTHFTLYNNPIYDTILNWNESDPYDWWLRNNSECIFSHPFIAKQANGFSDIEGIDKDYNDIFNMFEDKIKLIYEIIFKEGFVGKMLDWTSTEPDI